MGCCWFLGSVAIVWALARIKNRKVIAKGACLSLNRLKARANDLRVPHLSVSNWSKSASSGSLSSLIVTKPMSQRSSSQGFWCLCLISFFWATTTDRMSRWKTSSWVYSLRISTSVPLLFSHSSILFFHSSPDLPVSDTSQPLLKVPLPKVPYHSLPNSEYPLLLPRSYYCLHRQLAL